LFLYLVFSLVIIISSVNAIIIDLDKNEFLVGEDITFKIYTSGNATIQLINTSVVWEGVFESGTVRIPTGNLSEGSYTIYAVDEKGEALEDIRIVSLDGDVKLRFISKVEGNLTIEGETSLPDGYDLKIKVNGYEKDCKIEGGKFKVKFTVESGYYDVRVYFGSKLLNESGVYVEGFKIKSVKIPREIYEGEPLIINISTNYEGFDTKITIYNETREVKTRSKVNSYTGLVVVEDTWLEPGSYSVVILVIHGNSTDVVKLPLSVRKTFLDAEILSTSDNKVKIKVYAPQNHRIWVISGNESKKVFINESRSTEVEINMDGEVEIYDAMNLSDEEFFQKLNESKLPHLVLNKTGVKVFEERKEEKVPAQSDIKSERVEPENRVEDVNLVALIISVVIVGGTLSGMVLIFRK